MFTCLLFVIVVFLAWRALKVNAIFARCWESLVSCGGRVYKGPPDVVAVSTQVYEKGNKMGTTDSRSSVCMVCDKRDFADNMIRAFNDKEQYCHVHKECDMKRRGVVYCPHCTGTGEVKKEDV